MSTDLAPTRLRPHLFRLLALLLIPVVMVIVLGWVTAAKPRSSAWMPVVIAILAAGLLLMVLTVKEVWAFARAHMATVREAIDAIAPAGARPAPAPVPAHLAMRLVIALLLTGIVSVGVWRTMVRFAPNAPEWALPVTVFVACGVATWSVSRIRRSTDGAAHSRSVWEGLEWLFLAALLIFGPQLFEISKSRLKGHGGGWAPIAIVAAFVGLRFVGPFAVLGWAAIALRRGDYPRVFRCLNLLRNVGWVREIYAGTLASALTLAGRPAEAEHFARESITSSTSAGNAALGLEALADAVADQDRFSEAEDLYRRSIRGYPNRGGSRDGLASLFLRQGQRLDEALQLTAEAVELETRRSLIIRILTRSAFARMWATRAWALAAAGRRDEANGAIREAFRKLGGNIPEAAAVHFRAGMVAILARDRAEARREFETAIRLDPSGRAGRQAHQAIAQLSG